MSSVGSKRALLIAFGGISIAALFVWFYQAKREREKHEKTMKALKEASKNQTCAEETTKDTVEQKDDQLPSVSNVEQVVDEIKQESDNFTDEVVKSADETPKQMNNASQINEKEDPSEEENSEILDNSNNEEKSSEIELEDNKARGDELSQEEKIEEVEEGKEVEIPSVSNQEELKKVEVENPATEELEQEEEIKKVNVAPIQTSNQMELKKKTEQEQIPEEPTPTKVMDHPLTLDINAQMSPASFSWSEEMNKIDEDDYKQMASSDMEPSPISPKKTKNENTRSKKSSANKNGKKAQRRLSKHVAEENNKAGEAAEESVNGYNAGDASVNREAPSNEDGGYEKSDSPGLDSQNSEISSQDSGRATGGLASSLSPPMDENAINGQTITDDLIDPSPMYEFEIPNTLVGLIIGIKGKTIKELSTRTNVRMLIRQHHTPEKVKTHQICQVRGKREEINHCLQMLRRRFPSPRFPELNLQPVLPPPLPNNFFDMLTTQPTWLTLPEDINCEVAISSIIDPSHFFVQQPTHPSFASLRVLDMYMLRLYGEHSNLPELPVPCQEGLLCAAPVVNAWFRAVTVHYYEDSDEVFVKFVDYGGYSKMPRCNLRQIRTDLMSLPFQSTEVLLAHVRPIDGTSNWCPEAMQEFSKLCTGKVISSKLVGYDAENRIPMVELYVPVEEDGKQKQVSFDQHLMNKGYARTADPSKMIKPSITSAALTGKRPSLASQTAQASAAIAC